MHCLVLTKFILAQIRTTPQSTRLVERTTDSHGIRRGCWVTERIFRRCLFLKNVGAPRCHNGGSHALLECLGLTIFV